MMMMMIVGTIIKTTKRIKNKQKHSDELSVTFFFWYKICKFSINDTFSHHVGTQMSIPSARVPAQNIKMIWNYGKHPRREEQKMHNTNTTNNNNNKLHIWNLTKETKAQNKGAD